MLSEKTKWNLKPTANTRVGEKREPVVFADTITVLLESVARTVEIHQPLEETYHGPGKLLKLQQILQEECDVQASRIIDMFKSRRNYEELAQQVKQSMRLLQKQFTAESKFESRDTDMVLSKVAMISSTLYLYMRFMRRRANELSGGGCTG